MSAVVVHLACSKCVLGGCENACGCLGTVEPWTTEGLLSWCAGYGPNVFCDAAKTHVAVYIVLVCHSYPFTRFRHKSFTFIDIVQF